MDERNDNEFERKAYTLRCFLTIKMGIHLAKNQVYHKRKKHIDDISLISWGKSWQKGR